MKCKKHLVLTGYRVQFADLRGLKPRTPKEPHTVAVLIDRQGLAVESEG